jgi:phosphoserine phosphatase
MKLTGTFDCSSFKQGVALKAALNYTFGTQCLALNVLPVTLYTHLTSGAHAALDATLLNLWVAALGAPLSHSARHAMWAVPAHPALLAAAHAAQHDSATLRADLSWRDFSVLAMDMDSTLINIECIDEIADYCGRKAQVSAITEAAMRGEITDFSDSLRRRVALLKGVPLTALQAVLNERLQLNPGAQALVQAAHRHGLKTLLVSGGFTFFTDAMQQRLGLSKSRSNTLNHTKGLLDGTVRAPIVDAVAKRDTLQALCESLAVPAHRAIAMGDGSNDLAMMGIAGLSVAYHAKPAVQAQSMCAIQFGGLDTVALWLEA